MGSLLASCTMLTKLYNNDDTFLNNWMKNIRKLTVCVIKQWVHILPRPVKNKTMAKYSKGAQRKVEEAMHEKKRGTLRSGRSGKKVTSRKQAIAIGLSEARKRGAKVPKKAAKKSGRKTSGTTRRKTAKKRGR